MRRKAVQLIDQDDIISIHAPVKGATQAELADKLKIGNFNPRTREGCDMASQQHCQYRHMDFNPRTREGCDYGTDRPQCLY